MQNYNLRLSDKEYKDLKKISSQTQRSINDLITEGSETLSKSKINLAVSFHPRTVIAGVLNIFLIELGDVQL